MKVGEVAKKAGVNVQKLHYYERVGVLKPKTRLESGYRDYDETAIRIIRFIKHAQDLGFSLDEIQGLLELKANKKSKCENVQGQAVRHLKDVDGKIRKLQAIKQTLGTLILNCKSRKTEAECPLLDCLDDEHFHVTGEKTHES